MVKAFDQYSFSITSPVALTIIREWNQLHSKSFWSVSFPTISLAIIRESCPVSRSFLGLFAVPEIIFNFLFPFALLHEVETCSMSYASHLQERACSSSGILRRGRKGVHREEIRQKWWYLQRIYEVLLQTSSFVQGIPQFNSCCRMHQLLMRSMDFSFGDRFVDQFL
jgi:hypothetical protein